MLTTVLLKITLDGPQSVPYGKMLDHIDVGMPQIHTHTYIYMKPSLHSGRAASTSPYAFPSASAGEQAPCWPEGLQMYDPDVLYH